MTSTWRRRLLLTVIIAVAATVAMLLLGMHPRVVLVGAIVAAVATICWLVLDVGPLVEEVDWERHADRREFWPRSDMRVNLIRARLHRERSRGDEWASTGDDLAALIGDRLHSAHGIDPVAEPAAAAEVLGPELAAFMDDPERRRQMSRFRSLPATVALIERL